MVRLGPTWAQALWRAAEERRNRNKAEGAERFLLGWLMAFVVILALSELYSLGACIRKDAPAEGRLAAYNMLGLLNTIPLFVALAFLKADHSVVRRVELLGLGSRYRRLVRAWALLTQFGPAMVLGAILPATLLVPILTQSAWAILAMVAYPAAALGLASLARELKQLVAKTWLQNKEKSATNSLWPILGLGCFAAMAPGTGLGSDGNFVLRLAGSTWALSPDLTGPKLTGLLALFAGILSWGLAVAVRLAARKRKPLTTTRREATALAKSPWIPGPLCTPLLVKSRTFFLRIAGGMILTAFMLWQLASWQLLGLATVVFFIRELGKGLYFLGADSPARKRLDLSPLAQKDTAVLKASVFLGLVRALPFALGTAARFLTS